MEVAVPVSPVMTVAVPRVLVMKLPCLTASCVRPLIHPTISGMSAKLMLTTCTTRSFEDEKIASQLLSRNREA